MVRTSEDRAGFLRKARRETRRWTSHVQRLEEAFRQRDPDDLPVLHDRLLELSHKCARLETKVAALERHQNRCWDRAVEELREAHDELRRAWRSVLQTLDRNGLFP